MNIYDGNKLDTTNFDTDKYLKINSCGIQNISLDYSLTIRDKGRRDYHLLILRQGSCRAHYRGESYTLSSGDIIIYPPGEPQKYIFSPHSVSLWCHFAGTAVREILASYGLCDGVRRAPSGNDVYERFMALVRQVNGGGSEGLINLSFLELLYCLSLPEEPPRSEASSGISEAVNYIHENYHKNISLDRLAAISRYSKSRFSHIFSETMGTTPIRYLNALRLETSREMLTSTGLSIGEIAASCGFDDQLYYSKLFKKKYGIPPSDYRNNA